MDRLAVSASHVELELKASPFGDLTIAPGERHFGPSALPDEIQVNGLRIGIGDRPLPRNLRKLYEKSHAEIPPDLAVFDSYDLWLIPHSVGILRKFGSAKVKSVGYEADFQDAEQVYTLDMLPQTRFVSFVGGELKAEADVGVEGHAQLPETARAFLNSLESLGGDASLRFSSEAKLLGRISFAVMSPVVQSIGVGRQRISWQLDVDEKPLLGDQMLLQTIAVPAGTPEVKFKAKAYALIRSQAFSFAALFETAEIEVVCPLT